MNNSKFTIIFSLACFFTFANAVYAINDTPPASASTSADSTHSIAPTASSASTTSNNSTYSTADSATTASTPITTETAIKKLKSSMKSKKKSPKVVKKPDEYFTIPVPQAHLNLESQYLPPENKSKSEFDFQVSTWTPLAIKDEVSFAKQSQLETHPISKVSVHYVSAPLFDIKSKVAIKSLIGASFAQATKTMDLVFHDNSTKIEELFNFYSLKFGIECSSFDKIGGFFEPMIHVSYLPMWTQSASTEINNGVDRTSSALEYAIGFGFSNAKVSRWLGFDDVAVQVGYEKTQGLKGIPYEGSGYTIGTRIQL